MTVITQALRWFGHRVNPIVVRELRQTVRSRFVTSIFMLLLVAMLGATSIFAIALRMDGGDMSLAAGEDITMTIVGILFFVCMLFVPIYTGLRLVFERRGVQADLMFITTLSPGAVIRGKMLSAMMLSLLIFSACLPFLTFTYLLRGVDLPALLLGLAFGFLGVIVATQVALFFATLPMGITFRVLLSLGGVVGMGFGAAALTMAASELQYFGLTYNTDFWIVAGMILLGAGLTVGLLYVLSVAILSPPSANRTLPVRLFLAGLWGVTLLVACGLAIYESEWDIVVFGWTMLVLPIFLVAFFVSLCERQEWGPRIRRHIPATSLSQLVAFLFYSGAAGGIVWSLLMLAATLTVSYAAYGLSGGATARLDSESLRYLLLMCLYPLAYGFSAFLLWLGVFKRWFSHHHIWVIALSIAMVCTLLPFIASLLYTSPMRYYRNTNPLMLLSPVSLIVDDRSFALSLTFVAFWAGTTGLVVFAWAAGRLG